MELKEEKHEDESSLKTALLSNLRIVFLPATYILHIALKEDSFILQKNHKGQ